MNLPPTATTRPDAAFPGNSRILIVDRSSDSRDVLRTVLQRRGIDILEASEAQQGLELARRHLPSLIVLDLETTAADTNRLRQLFAQESQARNTPLVLLGTLSGDEGTRQPAVSKPYHYGPLIRKIEELLASAEPVMHADSVADAP